MSDETDPDRFIDSSHAEPSLREALRAVRGDVPSNEQRAALVAGIAGALETGGDAAATSVAKGAAASGGAKAAGIAVLAVAVAGGVWVLRSPEPSPPVPSPPGHADSLDTPLSADQSPTAPEPTASSTATAAEVVARPPPEPSATAQAAGSKTSKGPQVEREVSGPSEAQLLGTARRALRTDPKTTLELTAEHRRRFPKSLLSQERDVLEIEALRRVGRGDESEQRAKGFEEKHPDSIHRRSVKKP